MKTEDDRNGLLTELPVDSIKLGVSADRSPRRIFSTNCIHLFLLYILNGSLVLALVWSLNRNHDPSITVYSPASVAVEYETKVFYNNVDEHSPYEGEPNDEKDALWDNLYGNGEFTMLDKESADKLPNKTAEVPGTGGKYIVSLEMFHQLHCLNLLRKHNYPERYPNYRVFYPNGTRIPSAPVQQYHLDHCIDRLRQGVMCAGDLGTLFWTWDESREKYMINMQSTHSCRNFDKIREWALEKMLPGSEIDSSIITS